MRLPKRFESILSKVDIQLASSLPVFNNGKEYVFFYKIKVLSHDEYIIPEIKYIAVHDIDNNIVDVLPATEVVPYEIINEIILEKQSFHVSAKEELLMENEYLMLYEDLFKDVVCKLNLNTKDTTNLKILFEKLIEGTNLEIIYYFLGKELFEIVYNK